MRFQSKLRGFLASFLLAPWLASAADSVTLPPFKELFSLIESNLAGALPAELEQSAVRGLLAELGGKVTLLTGTNAVPTNAPGVLRTNVYDTSYGYLRIGRLTDDTAGAFKAALLGLRATNELKGLVVDLRFAGGTNYAAAMAVADLFMTKEQPLLHLDDAVLKSTAKTDAIKLPAVVLVNRRTVAAAEALAGVLRHHNAALMIGGRTAGEAMLYKDFTLSNGQRLRMASRYIRVAEGALLPSKGLRPDIEVGVSEADDKRYAEDAYAMIGGALDPANATSRLFGRGINEAELVRRHREEQNPDAQAEPEKPAIVSAEKQVRDPVLGRALDLLKGLAVMKRLD